MGDARDIRAFSNRGTNFLTINIQQDKMLEQQKRFLNSEKDYSLRAMEGDKNIIRARQQKFKARVSKIKSHLTEEQIIELKKSDIRVRTSKSHIGFSSKTSLNGSHVPSKDKHRSRSASGRLQTRTSTLIDTVAKENQVSDKRVPRPVLVKHKQVYSPISSESDSFSEEEIPSPTRLSAGVAGANGGEGKRTSKTARTALLGTRATPNTPKLPSNFSCHDISIADDDAEMVSSSKHSRSKYVRTNSEEMSPEEKLRQDFRQMLIEDNEKHVEKCQRRTNEFLQKVNYDMQREQREKEERERQIARQRAEEREAERLNSKAAKLQKMREEIRKKKLERMKRGHDGEPEDMLERKEGENDDEYTERMTKWREEMKRIRYLRLDNGGQEMSDVVTLVTAGMAANKIWREGLAHDLI